VNARLGEEDQSFGQSLHPAACREPAPALRDSAERTTVAREAWLGGGVPLDWEEVKRRYGAGAQVPTVAGGKTLEVTGADDEAIYIRGGSLWKDVLPRADLEKAVALLEDGTLSRLPVAFVEDYHERIAPTRGTSAAHVLRDLGYLG
jgi:hypothetical protein